jgi:H+/gluconate symporter-like permease
MTWRQFFYPEKWGIRYTWKLTLMRALVAELILWGVLFLVALPMTTSLAFVTGRPFTNVLLAAWRAAWVLFVPLSPVPPLAYAMIAWHFNRHLQRVEAGGRLGRSPSGHPSLDPFTQGR